MPFTVTNRGKYYLAKTNDASLLDLRCAVFKGTPPAVGTIQDLNFLSELEAVSGVDEAVAANYARVDLAGVALTEDDSANIAKLTANTWTMASVAAGETWTMLAYFDQAGGADSARTLIGVDAFTPTLTTNGQNVNGPALEIDLI